MDFSQTQRDPTRKFVGLGAVIVFHIIIVYALITGLARKVVEVVKGPIEVKVIEEVIKKPPPPPELLPPPPKLQAPPPPFIPPPEINIQPPPDAGAHDYRSHARSAPGSAGTRHSASATCACSGAGCAKRCSCMSQLSRSAGLGGLSARSCARQHSGRGAGRIHARSEWADTRHRYQEQHESSVQQTRDTNDPDSVDLQRPRAGYQVDVAYQL